MPQIGISDQKIWAVVSVFGLLSLLMLLFAPSDSAQAACAALPTDKGQVAYSVTIPAAGNYRVWSRIYAPSAGIDSFYLQIDQTSCNILVGNGGSIPAGQLTWVDWTGGNSANKFNVNLTAGVHSVIMAGFEPNVGVDKLLFLSGVSCTPNGDGTNCTSVVASPTATPVASSPPPGGSPAPTPLSVGASKETLTVSGALELTTAASQPGAKVAYKVDGKAINGTQLDTTKLSNGQHTIEVTQTLPDGQVVTKTQTINVQNNWFRQLIAGWQKANLGLILGGLVVGLMLVGLAWWWYKYRRPQSPVSSSQAVSGAPELIMPQPPADTSDNHLGRLP